jgi:DNA polymerase-3 subunit delta
MAKGTCFLFLGPEIGEKQDAIDELRSRLKGKHFEEQSFYAGETPASAMVSVLQNGSLFSDCRLVFIKSAESLKKEEVNPLAAYMKEPQNDTTLILMSESVSLAKALESAVPPANKRIFWELFENRKRDWVSGFFRREGYRISEDGIEAILELVENNTDALRRECSHLMLFVGKDRTLSDQDVEKWLSHTREESVFTLFSRIAEGDFSRSVEILHTLIMAKESPIAIMMGLASCFRKLRDYLALLGSGGANDAEFKRIGLGSMKARRDYEQASRRYRPAAVDRCLSLTAEYDLLLRSFGTGMELLLLDRYLYKIFDTGQRG